MSNDLTPDKLEEMILEELQRLDEFTVTFKNDDSVLQQRAKVGQGKDKEIDVPDSWGKDFIKPIASADGNRKNFTDADVDASIGNAKSKATLQAIAADPNVKPSIKKYIDSKIGGTTKKKKTTKKAPAKKTTTKKTTAKKTTAKKTTSKKTTGASLAVAAGLSSSSKKSDWKDEVMRLVDAGNTADAKKLLAEWAKTVYSTPPTRGPYITAQNYINGIKPGNKPTTSARTGLLTALNNFETQLVRVGDPLTGAEELDPGFTNLGASAAGDYEAGEMPISRPVIDSEQGSQGNFGGAIMDIMNGAFYNMPGGNADTMEKRLTRITELSEAILKDQQVPSIGGTQLTPRQNLNAILALDYISAFAKFFESGSGAYLFEVFCGLISSGKVVGKAMKGDDFQAVALSGTVLGGSSKFYGSRSVKGNALSGFTPNSRVAYMIAQKYNKPFTGKVTQSVGTSSMTSDPALLVELEIHIVEIAIDKNRKLAGAFYPAGIDDTTGVEAYEQGGQVLFKFPANKRAKTPFRVRLAKDANTTGWKESLEESMQNIGGQEEVAYDLMKQYFEQTLIADNETKSYISSGNLADGNQALKALEEADKFQTQLFNSFSTGTGATTVGTIGTSSRTLEESKIQSLDDLIMETMREIQIKRKK